MRVCVLVACGTASMHAVPVQYCMQCTMMRSRRIEEYITLFTDGHDNDRVETASVCTPNSSMNRASPCTCWRVGRPRTIDGHRRTDASNRVVPCI